MKTVETGLETAVEQATVTTVTTTFKVSEERQQEIQKDLADEVFYQIYDNKEIFDRAVFKLQSRLGWFREDGDYHDKKMCKDRIVSGLYWRLSNAKISTLQGYLDNIESQRKLLGQVGFGASDEEKNSDKVYETVRKEVETYNWKEDTTSVGVKQVREYAQTVALDKDNIQPDGYTNFTLGDAISIDDVETPAIESLPDKLDVIQILKNTSLFTVKTQPFVQMLLTQGAEATKENLGLSQTQFNSKLKQVLKYVESHKNMFSAIPSGNQKTLTEISEFESVVQLYHESQVAKWLLDNQAKPWVNDLIESGIEIEREPLQEYIAQLKATYEKKVA